MKAVSVHMEGCCIYNKSKQIEQQKHNSKHVWLLCQSSCSSPSTKKLHGQGLVHGLFDAKYSIHLRVFRIPHFGNDFIKVLRLKVYFGIFQNVKPASDIIMIL